MERNKERYEFLRWGRKRLKTSALYRRALAFVKSTLSILVRVFGPKKKMETVAYPDTLVGTDSHTTMINALGVLGWGVGGIEAKPLCSDNRCQC